MKDLEKCLNNNDYCADKDACDKYVLKYCDPENNRKSYIRIADVAVGLLK